MHVIIFAVITQRIIKRVAEELTVTVKLKIHTVN